MRHVQSCLRGGEPADRVEAGLEREWAPLPDLWRANWRIEDQGKFARAIAGKARFPWLLFALGRAKGAGQSEEGLRRLWAEDGELIAEMLPDLGR